MKYLGYSIFLSLFVLGISQYSSAQTITINEVSSSNYAIITDEDGDYTDWIELYNTTNVSISLNGFTLTDDLANLQKWTFPDTTIGAQSYLLIYASGKDRINGSLHTNFGINTSGETIILTDNLTILDSLTTITLPLNVSYGRGPDGSANLGYFEFPTPDATNGIIAATEILDPPTCSHTPGYYAATINVTLTHPVAGVDIRYTLDGSIPTQSSPLYSGPIALTDNFGTPNSWSEIPTNPGFNYPIGDYNAIRADNRGWLPPYTEVFKANALRCKTFKTNYIPSSIKSQTFIIDNLLNSRYSTPIISIITDSVNFFNDASGIYVYGDHPFGNYDQSGRDWERPVHIEFFEDDGTLAFQQDAGARIHGGGGRHSTIKTLRLYARNDYGTQSFDYAIFPNENTEVFNRLLLRNGGHRPDCFPKDDLSSGLVASLPFDRQRSRHTVVLVNGEYWGVHTIKERFDDYYLSNEYHTNRNDVAILDAEASIFKGDPIDTVHYDDMLNFAASNDLSVVSNYDYMGTQMDIESYINYQASEIYIGNADWPSSNILFWRKTIPQYLPSAPYGHDGRWRWMFYDLDGAFGGSCNTVFVTFNTLAQAVSTSPTFGSYTKLFRNLLENDQFKYDFINRSCDLINSTFNSTHVRSKIDEIDTKLSPEMLEHVARWRYPSVSTTLADRANEIPAVTRWNTTLNELRDYADERPRLNRNHMFNQFGLSDSSYIDLDVNDTTMGKVKINWLMVDHNMEGITGSTYPWQGIYFNDIPIPLKAIANPGYRFVEWLNTGLTNDTITINIASDTTFTAIFEADPTYTLQQPSINELMAKNTTIADEYGQTNDWLELYNPNPVAFDVGGYYLTNSMVDSTRYQFPLDHPDCIIPPFGFLLVWADNQPGQGALHTNFKLDSSAGYIAFHSPDSIVLLDSVSYGPQSPDVSFGRMPDGDPNWIFFTASTPGVSNTLTNVEEVTGRNPLIAYPNPLFNGSLTFNKRVTIEVFDLYGRKVLYRKKTRQIEANELSKGVFIIRTDKGETFKLIRL
jgi:hypothetical protein